MSYSGSVCNVPSDLGACYGSVVPYNGMLSSYGVGSLFGTGAWSGLGSHTGASVTCTDQLPASEVVIQPPPSVVTIPGPILSSTTEPVAIASMTPFSTGYSGLGFRRLSLPYYGAALGGYGRLGYGGYRRSGSYQRFPPLSGWGYGASGPCVPYRPC